jgi:hypothetical protein
VTSIGRRVSCILKFEREIERERVCVCVCVYFGREDRHKLMARRRVPPGFRFHPTDEELVAYYLKRKVSGRSIEADVIGVVELYKCEPWDLPGMYVGG